MLFEIEEHLGKRFEVIDEEKNAQTLYIEIPVSQWIKRCQELSRIKKARNSYREVSIAKGARWIEKLLSIYQACKNFLDGLSSC